MKKASYEEILFVDKTTSGFCISLYASNYTELARLMDEAKLVAQQDLSAVEYSVLFDNFEAEASAIDTFPIAVFINSEIRFFIPLFNCAEELFVISTSFHVKPLIKLHQRNKDVALLHFTKSEVRLFQVNIKNLVLLDVFKTPVDIQGYVSIDRFVTDLLSDKKSLLIFSGEEKSIKIFKRICLYGNVFGVPLEACFKGKSRDLVRIIYRHIESYFQRLEEKAVDRFINARNQGRLVTDVNEIFHRAKKGRY